MKQILIESWHEFAPVPTSILSDTDDIKICTAKSVLKKVLKSTVSTRHFETQIICNVIAVSAVLYVHHCGVVAIRQDLAVLYFVFVKVVLYAGINKQSLIVPEHISFLTIASS